MGQPITRDDLHFISTLTLNKSHLIYGFFLGSSIIIYLYNTFYL